MQPVQTASNLRVRRFRPGRLRCATRVGSAAVKVEWVLFDADGVLQGARQGWIQDVSAQAGSRSEEFLLAIAAADVACLTGKDFRVAMQEVLRQFDIDAPFEQVIDRDFGIEVRQPMLDAVRAVRDLGLRCALATNQQNLRGGYRRSSLASRRSSMSSSTLSSLGLRSLKRGTFK